MNFRHLLMGLLAVSVLSCRKPEIKIPVNDNPGLTNINDISQVYIFMKTTNGDTVADMHDGQIITTTHWVVHIDRRLRLKNLVVPWQKLYKKRHKKSIHSKPGTKLYLSHIDSVKGVMALTDFTRMQVKSPFYTSRSYVRKYPARYRQKNVLHIDIKPEKILIDTLSFDFPRSKAAVIEYLYRISKDKKPYEVMLNADYNISYERFNDAYSFFALADSTLFRIDPYLFVYNPQDIEP